MGFSPKNKQKEGLFPLFLFVHRLLGGAAFTRRAGAAMTDQEYVIAELIIGAEIETAALTRMFARHRAAP